MKEIAYILFCLAMAFSVTARAEDSTSPALFSAMKNRMSYIGERQGVLSKNIANANTPDYKARDLEPFKSNVAGGSHKLQMRATNPNHFAGSRGGNGKFQTIKDKDTFETTIAGNNVSLDEEMKKVAQNNLDYQETTNLYKKWSGIMRTAVNGGRQ